MIPSPKILASDVNTCMACFHQNYLYSRVLPKTVALTLDVDSNFSTKQLCTNNAFGRHTTPDINFLLSARESGKSL